jgi:hypothetical protein
LAWSVKVSRDSQPAYLYAGWLNDRDDPRRLQAAQELGGLETELRVAVSALVGGLRADRAAAVRKQSAVSLARVVVKLNDSRVTEKVANALVEALQDEAPTVRAAAANALGQIGPAPDAVIPPLLESGRRRGLPLGRSCKRVTTRIARYARQRLRHTRQSVTRWPMPDLSKITSTNELAINVPAANEYETV